MKSNTTDLTKIAIKAGVKYDPKTNSIIMNHLGDFSQMTGTQALQHLRDFNKSKDKEPFYRIIKKDLEILDILKNKLEIKSLDIGIEDIFLKGTNYIVMFEEEEDFNKVKEWLDK